MKLSSVFIAFFSFVIAHTAYAGDTTIVSKKSLADETLKLPTGFNAVELQTFKNLKKLRNAIAHGTDANGTEIEAIKTREAIDDENKLKQIFNDGNNLFAKIMKGEIGKI